MKADRPSLDDVKAWPATVDMTDACRALGISRSGGYELLKRRQFPCKVVTIGTRVRVVTASLIALLDVG